jgi:anti-sigma factor RsiW
MPTRIDERACRKVQAKLDSYIDNELLTESNLELSEHLERCPACAGDAAARRAVRARLQHAVRETPLPSGLEGRVRSRLWESRKSSRTPWLMAIAATIVVCAVPWAALQDRPLSAQLLAVMRIGLNDHVHCAVIRQRSNPARGVDKLAPAYKPVLAAVRDRVPSGMQLAVAHECHFDGRTFIHMTFRNDGHLLSVIVTRKRDGEAFAGLRTAVLDGHPVAGTESGGFLVYTVSDLPASVNRSTLEALAPSLRSVLGRLA